jgi:hypothetical protein
MSFILKIHYGFCKIIKYLFNLEIMIQINLTQSDKLDGRLQALLK